MVTGCAYWRNRDDIEPQPRKGFMFTQTELEMLYDKLEDMLHPLAAELDARVRKVEGYPGLMINQRWRHITYVLSWERDVRWQRGVIEEHHALMVRVREELERLAETEEPACTESTNKQ